MQLYKLEGRDHPWGGYSNILFNGEASRAHLSDETLKIDRVGLFVPPIYRPLALVIVSDSFKKTMERERLFDGIDYRPTKYRDIVDLPWHTWDLSAEDPPVYPDSGEPEDYILDATPDQMIDPETVAKEMEKSWELVLPIRECKIGYRDHRPHTVSLDPEIDYSGLFYHSDKRIHPLVDEPTKAWLTDHAGEWVSFIELKVVDE